MRSASAGIHRINHRSDWRAPRPLPSPEELLRKICRECSILFPAHRIFHTRSTRQERAVCAEIICPLCRGCFEISAELRREMIRECRLFDRRVGGPEDLVKALLDLLAEGLRQTSHQTPPQKNRT